MSASSTPTFRPRSRKPSARLIAVVDLPTPPLPEATAMIAFTPGTPDGPPPCAWRRSVTMAVCRCRRGLLPPPARFSAVSATMTEVTPGMARTASSTFLRIGSQAFTAAASTVIEKNTLPSLTTISDSVPVFGNGLPSGALIAARPSRICCFVGAMTFSRADYIRPQADRSTCQVHLFLTSPLRRSNWRPEYTPGGPQRPPHGGKTMAKVAFLGLGVMGYPMAGHLKTKGGHEVTVYNRTAAKAEKWVTQFGGKSAKTPREAAEGQDFVMCCVGNDNDLREVTLGADGAFRRHEEGRDLRRSHHRLRRYRARALCRRQEKRL